MQIAICPSCDAPIKLARGEALPPRVVPTHAPPEPVSFGGSLDYQGSIANAPRPARREGVWLIWVAVAFAGVWVLAILAMLIALRGTPTPVATTVSPPPAPVVVKPAPAPASPPSIFSEEPLPPPVQPVASPPPPEVSGPTPREGDRREPLRPAGPPPLRIVPANAALSDADVGAAIERGVEFLLTQFDGKELRRDLSPSDAQHEGLNALALYALLHCSQATKDTRIAPSSPFMRDALEAMKSHRMRPDHDRHSPIVYSRSVRASALTVYNRPGDNAVWRQDVAWLIGAANQGAYTYDDYYVVSSNDPQKPARRPNYQVLGRDPGEFAFDSSNSQYGLLGVWAGAERGYGVSDQYWRAVERHWNNTQLPSGEWSYGPHWRPNYHMTVAGITALLVTHDYLDALLADNAPRRRPFSEQLQRGLKWLETGDNALRIDNGMYVGYGLFGLERVGLASGYKYFGKHDWYRVLATRTLQMQQLNGAVRVMHGRDAVIETSFSLLFLARGRHPVMMNKLRYDGNWANRPRDAGKLADFASQALERPINWQVVDLQRDWFEWADAPLLYIAGDDELEVDESDLKKLVEYARYGGLIFTHADGGNPRFTRFAEKLAAALGGELQELPHGHAVYSMQFNIDAPRPRLMGVSNGTRLLMVHAPVDFASAWQARDPRRRRAAMQMAINLYIYGTGKAEPRNRIDSPYIAAPEEPATRTINLARIEYNGDWNPEPAGWERFNRFMYWETGWSIKPTATTGGDLTPERYPLAHLTGTAEDSPDEATLTALRRYVEGGGVLLIDVGGGSPAFHRALEQQWLPGILAGVTMQPMELNDPIFTGRMAAAADLTTIQLRPYTQEQIGRTGLRFKSARMGKGRIVFSSLDLSSGLLGSNTWGILGYTPEYSQALVKNIVLATIAETESAQ